MSRLIIHVGTHKTGTTTIQSFLAANRARLDEAGICYPDPTRFLGKNSEAHHGVAAALARDEGPFSEPLLRFREFLRRRLGERDAVILSSEAFFRHVLPGDQPAGTSQEAFWTRREAYLDRMAEYFGEFDPTISIYFRNPVTFAESRYANHSIATPAIDDFDGFLLRTAWSYEYGRHVETLRRRFPDTQAHSFERSSSPDLIAGFFADHGLPAPPETKAERLRVAVPNRAVLWIQRLKAEGTLSDRERARRWHFALRDEAAGLFAEETRSSFWESAAQRLAFFERYGAPVGNIVFDPPADGPAMPRTVWDDAMHATANAAYAAWLPANAARLNRREAAGLLPYEPDQAAAPGAERHGARRVSLLRRLGRRLARAGRSARERLQ